MQRITISGFAGTGKSTVGKILQEKLNFEFISVGNFSREYANEKFGLTINQFQEKCKNEPNLDEEIDEQFRKNCNERTRIVIDYRLGFKFVQNAFHVLLKVSEEAAVCRIKLAKRQHEDTSASSIKERNDEMKHRFVKLYGVDFTDEGHYHLVIDTDLFTPDQVAEIIIQQFDKYENT